MTEDELRKSMFKQIDRIDDPKARLQLRSTIEQNINDDLYNEEYWNTLMDKMIDEGELMECVNGSGNIVVVPNPKYNKETI